MNNRDMYYNSYGYEGFTPPGNIPSQFQPGMNSQMPTGMNPQMPTGMNPQMPNSTYASSQFNDMNERVSRLERQIKRLDQRLTRLETPYANANPINTEPDNNMYMM